MRYGQKLRQSEGEQEKQQQQKKKNIHTQENNTVHLKIKSQCLQSIDSCVHLSKKIKQQQQMND